MLRKCLIYLLHFPIEEQKRRIKIWYVFLVSLTHANLPLRKQYSLFYDFHGPVNRSYMIYYFLVYHRRRYFFSFYYVIVWHLYVILFLVWYSLLLQLLVVFWNLNKRLVFSAYWLFIYLLHRYKLYYYWTRRGYYLYTLRMYIKRKLFFFATETPVSCLFSSGLWVLCC